MRPNNVNCSYIYNYLSISTDLDWIIQAKVAIFIRFSAASEKHFHHWAVEMTFLTPPLDFDQSGHTQPSPRHHGSIYVDRFGYDAASSGEMNHRRRRRGSWTSSFLLWRCIGGGFYSLAIMRKLVVNPREMFWRLLCGRIPFVWAVTSGAAAVKLLRSCAIRFEADDEKSCSNDSSSKIPCRTGKKLPSAFIRAKCHLSNLTTESFLGTTSMTMTTSSMKVSSCN